MILRAFLLSLFTFFLTLALPAHAQTQIPYEIARLQKDFPVTLYTSPNCKEGCDLARDALNKRSVPFKEVQVWNQETSDELKAATGALDVPSLTVGRSVFRGFEQGAFDALLDSAGYPQAGIFPPGNQKAPPPPSGSAGTAQAAKPAPAGSAVKPGPYDLSGLKGPEPKPGPYDPSGLKGPEPKPGRYGTPLESR